MRKLGWWILGISLVACGGNTGEEKPIDATPNVDLFAADTAKDAATETKQDVLVDTFGEVANSDGTASDLPSLDTQEPDCVAGTGCVGEPCTDNAECKSLLCLMHMGDRVCAENCIDSCPTGWSCRQITSGDDLSFACVSDFTHLCLPCNDNADCSNANADNICVSYADEGAFCGAVCDETTPCPLDFICEEVASIEGGTSRQCVRIEGTCSCSVTAVELGLSTQCGESNDSGHCVGSRSCTADGLTDCDALTPVEETCNGLDDDCDGELDEVDCDDDDPCTEDSCNGVEGCVHLGLSGVACDDENACTGNDLCAEGLCQGAELICVDDNLCTDDNCDPESGCSYTHNNAPCSDGENCSIGDQCNEGACTAGVTIGCDDNNLCTDDSCSEEGGCTFTPNTELCDDGNACTTVDQCLDGGCKGSGPPECTDGNFCTDDSCDPDSGCVHNDNSAPCSDGDICTVEDICLEGACASGTALTCQDDNVCTNDGCNSATGCTFVDNTASCDDSNACTTADQCLEGACSGGAPPVCDDEKLCTNDGCDPLVGCTHDDNTLDCSDGSACTLDDQCSGGVCASGVALVCDDENECTDDSCEDAAGCVYSANTALCSDSNHCTVGDVCGDSVCVSGPIGNLPETPDTPVGLFQVCMGQANVSANSENNNAIP